MPDILKEDGNPLFGARIQFEPGKDDIVREAPAGGGYVVCFGDTRLPRARRGHPPARAGREGRPDQQVHAERHRRSNDEDPRGGPVRARRRRLQRQDRPGFPLRSELLKAGFKGKYNHIGTHKEGCGGLWQQMGFQGLDPEGITKAVKALL